MKITPLYLQFCLSLTKGVCCWHSISENIFINNLVVIQLLFAAGMDSLKWSFSTPSFYVSVFLRISLICCFKVLLMPFGTTKKAHIENLNWKLWSWQPFVDFHKTPGSLNWISANRYHILSPRIYNHILHVRSQKNLHRHTLFLKAWRYFEIYI